MTPNLLEATHEYWHKLNELEAAYQRGEVTLEEVDAKVKGLMTELGQSRRAAFSDFFSRVRRLWEEQRETIVGVLGLGVLTYGWLVVH
ncbi:hypothetical protein Q2T42_20435 [Leptolyngbya boryana CZ1]|uniref:Uncharacterized protein n=2 Tax=Leptolyngbya boryana TaxID=1184 RepID=A0A1Z4JJL6_LEPBY|nr:MULTISPECIES: hypothetical protein [Leptolyngbya]BAY56931.1 hypothetical protein NIES2135_37930 [Leptolyngbya boryana NIES-2135]MBD1854772.1 hypothetical protein [Leptolyngbya sp. FACHB-1624]MBD2369009.1 hypothetical protein [Leptolyngbya sp. FACHB-161]MBD2375783.1 hypothetical protein [Leptolyngbya sp. FACHB-238]MBD2399897.1 hypothetical protein [Leptolyngbya sp. FACHB-239]